MNKEKIYLRGTKICSVKNCNNFTLPTKKSLKNIHFSNFEILKYKEICPIHISMLRKNKVKLIDSIYNKKQKKIIEWQ